MSPRQMSIERYRTKATGYDASAQRTMALRSQTIVLLRAGVAPSGQVLAFEQSPDMFALAQARVAREGWANAWQVNEPADPWWSGPLRLPPWLKNRPCNTLPGVLHRPWQCVAERCTGIH